MLLTAHRSTVTGSTGGSAGLGTKYSAIAPSLGRSASPPPSLRASCARASASCGHLQIEATEIAGSRRPSSSKRGSWLGSSAALGAARNDNEARSRIIVWVGCCGTDPVSHVALDMCVFVPCATPVYCVAKGRVEHSRTETSLARKRRYLKTLAHNNTGISGQPGRP